MTYLKSWEDFEKAAEKLYLANPNKVRFTTKYRHSLGKVVLKMTDDVVCLQYKTEISQDMKKLDKFLGNLMRHMVSSD